MQPHHHLIVGGQRSGKSRQAERLAQAWLAAEPGHGVTVVATATAWDDEMRERIRRHQLERPAGFLTVEAPLHLAAALRQADAPGQLLLVDCLTLWLTNWLFPAPDAELSPLSEADRLTAWRAARDELLATLPTLQGRVVAVSNEVGWGVIPMSAGVRAYVDELGWLNQAVARWCGQLTLMVAGQAWTRPVEEQA
ncbi:MAG: hypothetical protein RI907_1019 [Pseudomonadota bacterium]|jgi:adenosylcobinamide kinase/adenosylcobinamide-phosphate guanylyltransferase